MFLGAVSLPRSYAPSRMALAPARVSPRMQSNVAASRAESDRVAAVLAAQGAALRAKQPHGLGPSSKWNSFSGEPLPAGTQLSPRLQAQLASGRGVTARWSPQQQLWISAI